MSHQSTWKHTVTITGVFKVWHDAESESESVTAVEGMTVEQLQRGSILRFFPESITSLTITATEEDTHGS